MWALVSHLGVPVPQICVGDLARHIEDHDADVRAEVICRVQLVERLLAGRVPNVYLTHTIHRLIRIYVWGSVGFTYQLYMSYFRLCSCSGT